VNLRYPAAVAIVRPQRSSVASWLQRQTVPGWASTAVFAWLSRVPPATTAAAERPGLPGGVAGQVAATPSRRRYHSILERCSPCWLGLDWIGPLRDCLTGAAVTRRRSARARGDCPETSAALTDVYVACAAGRTARVQWLCRTLTRQRSRCRSCPSQTGRRDCPER
jgi:hypothetical protein